VGADAGMKLIKIQLSQRQLIAFLVLIFLSVIGTSAYLIQEGFWANISSQGMIRLAKEDWGRGEYVSSINWYRGAYSSALEGGLRYEILKVYSYRIGRLSRLGKLSDALDVCKQAEMIWNQEGATSYTCFTIEQELQREQ
jgi:hypothetical protein